MTVQYNEKSLKKYSEPDRLDDYIRIATPGAWATVIGVFLVILALGIWGALGEVNGVSILQALFG